MSEPAIAGVAGAPHGLTQAEPASARTRMLARVVPLFAVTMFVGAALLFLVQPMFAKLALPRLGGSPSVWNTCVLFFQSTLLLGYLYAHVSTRCLRAGTQVLVHCLLLLTPFATLPLTIGGGQPPTGQDPVWWLLGTMTVTVGLPFFIVSTTAPLLQRWFAMLPTASAADPYFLYSASNLGSMLALLGYPLLLEPAIGTRQQTWMWTAGYLALVVLTGVCGLIVRIFGRSSSGEDKPLAVEASAPVSFRHRLEWGVLSFVPSSLMLGVTTHISTDVAAVPLLWVVPLAIYLATFVLAFAQRQFIPHLWLIRLAPLLIFGTLVTVLLNAGRWWLIPLHLAAFFVVAMICHRELALRRPHVSRLTEFYIWLSFGGMLGGVFNTLIAPQVFSRVLEYPIVLALAAVLRPSPAFRGGRAEPLPVLVGLPLVVLILCGGLWTIGAMTEEVEFRQLLLGFILVLTSVYMFANRPWAFGGMAFVIAAMIASVRPGAAGDVLMAGRSFFGVYRVVEASDHRYHLLQHGTTTHGRQELPNATTCNPTGYYHPAGPIGQVFARNTPYANAALVGLGSGALACYAKTDQRWTFYEIDPLIENIARDTRYFTYLQNSRGRMDVVLGDGRLTLERVSPATYDLIVVDAFSSDAIPVHMLTREALGLYVSRLRPDGILAFHISNRYLDLEPIVAATAQTAGLSALANLDDPIPEADAQTGRFASHWVVMARSPETLAFLDRHSGWRSAVVKPHVKPWTDDYSNILHVLTLQ